MPFPVASRCTLAGEHVATASKDKCQLCALHSVCSREKGPAPRSWGCCSPHPGRTQTPKLQGERWKQRPSSSLSCSSQLIPLQADSDHQLQHGMQQPQCRRKDVHSLQLSTTPWNSMAMFYGQ